MPVRNKHKRITWKVDRRIDPPQLHRRYVQDAPLTSEMAEALEGKLVPGAMFTVNHDMCAMDMQGTTPPPFPYLIEAWYPDFAVVKSGSLAIYSGTARVEEIKNSAVFRAPRHSFIINGTRYLVTNLNYFIPAL